MSETRSRFEVVELTVEPDAGAGCALRGQLELPAGETLRGVEVEGVGLAVLRDLQHVARLQRDAAVDVEADRGKVDGVAGSKARDCVGRHAAARRCIDRQRAAGPGEGDDTTRNRARLQLLGAAADDCAADDATRKDQFKPVLGDDGADGCTAEPDVLFGAAVDERAAGHTA